MTPQTTRGVLGGNSMAARTFREKEQQQSRVFFDVIFDVRGSDSKQRRRISLGEKHENFIEAVP